jgi:hypothetical protein
MSGFTGAGDDGGVGDPVTSFARRPVGDGAARPARRRGRAPTSVRFADQTLAMAPAAV